jgi:hypothetical protein
VKKNKGASGVAVVVVVVVILIVAVAAVALYYKPGTPTTSSSSSSTSPLAFGANLTAAPGVTTSATGQAIFQLSPDGQTLTYTLAVSNITNVFMAHIHLSPSMDIGVWLDPNPNTVASGGLTACAAVLSNGPIASCPGLISGKFSGVLSQGTITAADLSGNNTCAGCSGLSTPTMSALVAQIKSGQTFVNVHTMQNPGGEIQGTIVPAAQTFAANLTAAPGVTTSATGQAIFQLSPDGQTLIYTLSVSNISNVFMAHIHLSPSMDIGVWLDPNPNTVASGGLTACAAVLSNGPIASCPGLMSGSFSGVLAQGMITSADLSGNSTCAGCSGLSTPTMSALVAYIESGQTFVNVHTMQNPGGEIQGTIVAMG